jgi:hypothetical protein
VKVTVVGRIKLALPGLLPEGSDSALSSSKIARTTPLLKDFPCLPFNMATNVSLRKMLRILTKYTGLPANVTQTVEGVKGFRMCIEYPVKLIRIELFKSPF